MLLQCVLQTGFWFGDSVSVLDSGLASIAHMVRQRLWHCGIRVSCLMRIMCLRLFPATIPLRL